MRKRVPINTDSDECAVCIKPNYYKMSGVNFRPQIGGGKYAATGVMEIVYEEDNFALEPDA